MADSRGHTYIHTYIIHIEFLRLFKKTPHQFFSLPPAGSGRSLKVSRRKFFFFFFFIFLAFPCLPLPLKKGK